MAVRRFGVTRALGIAVEEKEGGKPITPAQLGTVLLVGESDRGPDEMPIVQVGSKKQAWRLLGNHRDGSYLMDAIDGFFAENRGGGRLYVAGLGPGHGGEKASMSLVARGGLGPSIPASIKAKSPGMWAGRRAYETGLTPADANDITNTTMKITGANWPVNRWAGATLSIAADPTHTYKVVSNTADTLTLAPGSTLADNLGGGGTGSPWLLTLDNANRYLAVKVEPGKLDPTHFAITVSIDGQVVKMWDDLTMDQEASNYAPSVINNDPTNHEIEFTDLRAAGTETTPNDEVANYVVPIDGITDQVITVEWYDIDFDQTTFPATVTAPSGYKGIPGEIDITVDDTDTTKFHWSALGLTGEGTFGTEVDPGVTWLPKFTVSDPGTVAQAGQSIGAIHLFPLTDDALVGGTVYPGYKTSDPYGAEAFQVASNTYNTITVTYGDPSNNGAVGSGDNLLVSYFQQCEGGYDGEPLDASGQAEALSMLGDILGQIDEFKQAGLIKIAAPGWTNSAVQKAGIAVAEKLSYQYRVEVPADQSDGPSALKWLNTNIGRSDFAVVNWPSYGYILDPVKSGLLKLVPLTGDILGVEAAVAKDYLGYHRPAAGIDAVLHRVVDLALDDIIDEELVSPTGVNIIKKYKGNFIIWGFRTLSSDPGWKWKNQREQMSYYERVLLSQFDWIVAMLNNKNTWGLLRASLADYFRGEWRKNALVGDAFKDACTIKIDEENNPNDSMENGDLFADITLHLPTAVERVTFRIGKGGITEL